MHNVVAFLYIFVYIWVLTVFYVFLQTLPGAFLHIARGLKEPKLRSDFLQRMLMLCSDVGLVAESKIGRLGTFVKSYILYLELAKSENSCLI